MKLFNFIKIKISEILLKVKISNTKKKSDETEECKEYSTPILYEEDEIGIKNKVMQEEMKHEIEEDKLKKEKKKPKEDTGLHKSKNNPNSNSLDSSSFDTYSTGMVRERYSKNSVSLNKIVRSIDRECLNLFEQFEVNYFEEIERYEAELEGILKFGRYSREEIGLEGEKNVHIELLNLEDDEYKIVHNILIESFNGKTSQIDTVIVSIYGVFVIETKNYKASIFGSEDSEYWNCYYDNRKHNNNIKLSKKLFNPIKQNITHILSLELLLERLNFNIPFYSIIVFNEEARLYIDTPSHVIKINELIGIIKKYKVKVMSYSFVKQIYNEILENNKKGYGVVKGHSKYVQEIISNKHAISEVQMRLEYFVTLYLIPGIGKWTIEFVQDNLDQVTTNIDDFFKKLSNVGKINPKISIPSKKDIFFYYDKALELINLNKKQDIALTPFYSNDYPSVLKDFSEHPLIMFSFGDLMCLNETNKAGILVSSKATDFAKRSARRFGEICADNNIVVVSIAGKGDNISAVRGALSKKGKVILIVPTQLIVEEGSVYSKLYKDISNFGGCVISFNKQADFKSAFLKNQYNQSFIRLIDKLIAVEVQHNPEFIKIVRLGVANKQRIAYLDQSNKLEQNRIYKEVELIDSMGGIPLKDKYDLYKYLHISQI